MVATSIRKAAANHAMFPTIMKPVIEFFAIRFELTESSG